MTTKTPTTASTPTTTRPTAVRAWLLWTAGFLAFPVAGVAGIAAAGRVDRPLAALIGGVATGAVLGLGQAVTSSGRLPQMRWTAATATGMGVGLLAGAHTVDYGTTMADLALMGALTGVVLGAAQGAVLPQRARARWAWPVAMPAVWATGWTVSSLVIGNSVQNQFTLFGASGAVTVSVLLGILLHILLPPATTPATATSAGVPS